MARNEALFQAVYTGDRDAAREAVQAALDNGESVESIMNDSLIAAMRQIGADFECGEAFVPEMLIAARAMDTALQVIEPLLVKSGVEPKGRVCIGTVQGDLHDIGKNLVAMMFEGAGFEVINLGINVDADKFIAAIREHQPDIIGMSALLTTTMPYMKVVVDALGEEGLRNEIYVMVGGAPVTENFAREVGADAYGRDAAVSVEIAKSHMQRKNRKAA